MDQVQQLSQPIQVPKQKENPNWLGMVIVGIIFLAFIGIGIGGYYLGTRKADDSADVSDITPTAASQKDLTKNWKTYKANGISIKYPPEWTANLDANLPKKELFDPNSVETTIGNGGGTDFIPTKFVSIIFINDATHSAAQFVDIVSQQPQYNGMNMERKSATLNGIPVEFFKESGEGTIGYDIVVSNGKEIILLNIPTEDPNSDPTISQMLATFTLVK